MMQLAFTKMQSLGNDFIVLDAADELNLTPSAVRALADRRFGVGCDQVLLVGHGDGGGGHGDDGGGHGDDGDDSGDEFVFTVFNADGSRAEHCGNGARCLARYLFDRGGDAVIRARIGEMKLTLTVNADDTVTVAMGVPVFAPSSIPFIAEREADTYTLDLAGESVTIAALAIGNPHAVRIVADAAAAPVAAHGALTENHPRFPSRVNASFMQVVARDRINLRVHERGVGETLGCGSGACAAVAAGVRLGLLDAAVTVTLPGGDAQVKWQGHGEQIFLTGPADTVFAGTIDLK